MRILLVEDETKIATLLITALKSEGFTVDHIADGEEGSYVARTNDYDLIVLDNQLPGKTGLEICADVRTAGKKIPILILSIVNDVTTKVDFLNAGADDYVAKPFSFEELLARIHALLRRPQSITEEVLTAGDVVLDRKRHIVTKVTEEISLTNKEFALLECLMRHKGMTVSRGKLLEHVWDMNANPLSNTIDTHIFSLRKKLSVSGQQDIIETVPGRGYRISQ